MLLVMTTDIGCGVGRGGVEKVVKGCGVEKVVEGAGWKRQQMMSQCWSCSMGWLRMDLERSRLRQRALQCCTSFSHSRCQSSCSMVLLCSSGRITLPLTPSRVRQRWRMLVESSAKVVSFCFLRSMRRTILSLALTRQASSSPLSSSVPSCSIQLQYFSRGLFRSLLEGDCGTLSSATVCCLRPTSCFNFLRRQWFISSLNSSSSCPATASTDPMLTQLLLRPVDSSGSSRSRAVVCGRRVASGDSGWQRRAEGCGVREGRGEGRSGLGSRTAVWNMGFIY